MMQLAANVTPSLLARDLDETCAFYHDWLGFRLSGLYPSDGPPFWLDMGRDDVVVQFYSEPSKGRCVEPAQNEILYFHPNDVIVFSSDLTGPAT